MDDDAAPDRPRHPPTGADALGKPLSVHLDLLRVGAALAVFLSHACKPGIADDILPNLVQNGSDAVTVFFVLSGFVIAHTAATKERTLRDYLVARLARLWSVALPAMLLAAVLLPLGLRFAPGLYASEILPDQVPPPLAAALAAQPGLRFLIGATFLNEAWNLRVIPFGDAPYWSISYEFCYYLFFGMVFYLRGPGRVLAALGVLLLYGPKVFLLFPVWAMGVWWYRRRPRVSPKRALVCMLAPIAIYLAFEWTGLWRLALLLDRTMPFETNWSTAFLWQYVLGGLVVLHLIGFDSLPGKAVVLRAARPIRAAAGMTLSLYLYHFPLLYVLAAALPARAFGPLRGLVIMATTLALVVVLSRVTEARKRDWRLAVAALAARLRRSPSITARPG